MNPVLRWLLPILILIVGAGGFAALWASRPASEPIITEEKAWIVAVEAVQPHTIAPTLTLYGRVESPRVAKLSAAVTADVKEVDVLEGQRVEVSQPLVTLDDRESLIALREREADVSEAQAQIDDEHEKHRNDLAALAREKRMEALARRALGRSEKLATNNLGSQAQLDESRDKVEREAMAVESRELSIRAHSIRVAQLEARLARARSLADRARLDVERTRIVAPFTGKVSAVLVSPGDRVRSGDRLLNVHDDSAVEIRAQIPNRYLTVIRDHVGAGERLAARSSVDGRTVGASLDRLTAEVGSGSGGVDGLFRVTDGGAWLQLGRTVKLTMDLPAEEGVIALPIEAIYGRNRVFTLDAERMRGLDVERVGETRDAQGRTRALVRAPALEPGELVVVTQLPNAIDGLRVRIAQPSGSN